MKSSIAVLAFVKLAPPFTSTGFWGKDPKIEDPQDLNHLERYLNGSIVEIWAYNNSTGQIYKKVNFFSDREYPESTLIAEARTLRNKVSDSTLARITTVLEDLSKLTKQLATSHSLFAKGVDIREWLGKLQKDQSEVESIKKEIGTTYLHMKLANSILALNSAAKFTVQGKSAIQEFNELSPEDQQGFIKLFSLEDLKVTQFATGLTSTSLQYQADALFLVSLIKNATN